MDEFDPRLLNNIMTELTPQAPTAPNPFEAPTPVQKQGTGPSYYGMDAEEMAEFLLHNIDQLSTNDYETLMAILEGLPYKTEELERMADAYFKPREPQPAVEPTPEKDDDDEDFPQYLAPMPATPVVRREPLVTMLPPSTGRVGAWWRKKK